MVYESVEELMASTDIMTQVSDVWSKTMSELNVEEEATIRAATALLRTDPSIILDMKKVSTEGSVGHELKRCYVREPDDDWDPSCSKYGLAPTSVVFRNRENGLHQEYGLERGSVGTIISTKVHPFKELSDNDRSILLKTGVTKVHVWHEQDGGNYKHVREFTVEALAPRPQVQEPDNMIIYILIALIILAVIILAVIYVFKKRKTSS